jgi:cardiolipin synthase
MRMKFFRKSSRRPGFKSFKNLSLRKAIFLSLFSLLLFFAFWILDVAQEVRMPEAGQPAELYANQNQHDLRQVFLKGIDEAKQSILLMIYTLTDDRIIKQLKQKSEEGIDVWVIYDAKASPYAAKKLGAKVKLLKRYGDGLMHQKIMVIDGRRTWIGSANMTGESLRFHGNLITAVHSQQIASFILEKAQNMRSEENGIPLKHRAFNVGEQEIELWFFPDDPLGAKKLVELLRAAKKSIRIAMFTWTRIDLANEVIDAKNRGINVEVVIDRRCGLGAGAQVVKRLNDGGVPVRLSQGDALLHHKLLIVDSQVLVNGSANWTKAAFTKNDDCYMILYDLTNEQKSNLDSLWNVIMADSFLLKNR